MKDIEEREKGRPAAKEEAGNAAERDSGGKKGPDAAGAASAERKKLFIPGEAALLTTVLTNSFGVVLMLYSGTGISAISSVPYAFSKVFPLISLGTWTYIFQGLLVLSLMIARKKIVLPYFFSFIVGFAFGGLLDLHKLWIGVLPDGPGWCIFYFLAGYLLISFGIALSNRCGLPIIPTDLFPRELSAITHISFPKLKIAFDVICLTVTACMTGLLLGRIDGLGIGTVIAALTMGKAAEIIGRLLDRRLTFAPAALPALSALIRRKKQRRRKHTKAARHAP